MDKLSSRVDYTSWRQRTEDHVTDGKRGSTCPWFMRSLTPPLPTDIIESFGHVLKFATESIQEYTPVWYILRTDYSCLVGMATLP